MTILRLFLLFALIAIAGCQREHATQEQVAEVKSEATEAVTVTAAPEAEQVSGESVYQQSCAACHDGGIARSPHKTFLTLMTASSIKKSLDEGLMKQQAAALSNVQKTAVAEYLAGPIVEDPPLKMCPQTEFDLAKTPLSKDMGFDLNKTRYQPAEVSGLDKSAVPKLKLKWAFAFPSAFRARSLPLIAGGMLFVGSHDGTVYALDPETACVHWTYKAAAEVRTALTSNDWQSEGEGAIPTLFFGDIFANAYAIDARSGKQIWKVRVEDHDNATITGSPVYHQQRLFVPVSSLEIASAADPSYQCCTFRGSMLALNAASGEQIWKTYTIEKQAEATYENKVGTQMFGPSGSPIWNSPTIDVKRNVLYVGTGENYSSPADESSDAIHAFDMETGEVKWRQQVTRNDAWNMMCETVEKIGCPKEDGPDYDFAASPILISTSDGKQVLVAGQKSGWLYGMDPDNNGEIVWRNKVGRGGVQGGIHFGIASEGETVYVPVTDFDGPPPFGEDYGEEKVRPGLYAVNANNGEFVWKAPHPTDVCNGREFCDPGVSAAISVTPGVVFSGGLDGYLRAHDSSTGEIIWQVNTAVDYETANGVKGRGGSIGGPGPTIIDGTVYVNSGYGMYFHMPGNVLLSFSVD